jgi:hypothetical protein
MLLQRSASHTHHIATDEGLMACRKDESTAIRAEQRIFQCRRFKEFKDIVEAQTDGGDRAIVDDDPVGVELFLGL